jgi:hypothetical protein
MLTYTESNIDAINTNTETLICASKEIRLAINVEEIKCMLLARRQNAGQYRDMKIGNSSFENESELRYLRTTVTNKNFCFGRKLSGD